MHIRDVCKFHICCNFSSGQSAYLCWRFLLKIFASVLRIRESITALKEDEPISVFKVVNAPLQVVHKWFYDQSKLRAERPVRNRDIRSQSKKECEIRKSVMGVKTVHFEKYYTGCESHTFWKLLCRVWKLYPLKIILQGVKAVSFDNYYTGCESCILWELLYRIWKLYSLTIIIQGVKGVLFDNYYIGCERCTHWQLLYCRCCPWNIL